MVITYSDAKVQGQQSVDSKDRAETDRQTEAVALCPLLMRSLSSAFRSEKRHKFISVVLSVLPVLYFVCSHVKFNVIVDSVVFKLFCILC